MTDHGDKLTVQLITMLITICLFQVKLKNRSGSDQEVEIVGQGGGHFKIVHSEAMVSLLVTLVSLWLPY